ncbi:MAG: ABC transporter permease, partial [Clostridia bacterium]|nr:ABC transporter permease [Clostridia bacterium]
MRVFKSCFKVLRKNLGSMLIYFFIFLFFAVLLSNTNADRDQKNTFTDTRCDVAFFNEDGNTPLVQGLKDCLSKNANFVSIPDTLEGRQDALFYQSVEYIVRIPKGFTESFLNGGSVQLERTTVPSSTMGVYMDSAIKRYLSLASIAKSVPGISQMQIVTDVKNSLAQQAAVDVHSFGGTTETKRQTYYFRYLAYVIMAIVILGVSALMMAFNQP